MADRRTAERLIVHPDSLLRITPPEGLRAVTDSDPAEEQTQPMRLSFLALLAERDPAVQTRLELRRRLALDDEEEDEIDDGERPTDPLLPPLPRD